MKKIILLSLLVSTFSFSSCKKKSIVEEIKPEVPTEVYTRPKYLKSIKVPGAITTLPIDTANVYDAFRYYLVSLPESYTDDKISIELGLPDGTKISSCIDCEVSGNTLKFSYKGLGQLSFILTDKNNEPLFHYVFVDVAGQPKVELLNKEIPLSPGYISIPLKIISGLGTLALGPEGKAPLIRILDTKTNTSTNGRIDGSLSQIYIEDIGKVIDADRFKVEITLENQKSFILDDLRFKRQLPRAGISGNVFIYSPKDSLLVQGGYFSPNKKYSVKFSNDYIEKPVNIDLSYKDLSVISAVLPKEIEEGSYQATFFENDIEMGKGSFYFSEKESRAIETIWQNNAGDAFTRNTERLLFKGGDTFYAKTSPLEFAYGGKPASEFDPNKVPELQLRNGLTVINIKPEIVAVSWAVAGVSFSVGKYVIPASITSGSYEVSPVFADKKQLKPYWSKMEIR